MNLTGLHLLVTYQCTYACDHCFVWGSPNQSGVFTLPAVKKILDQAGEIQTIRTIYFEGGEPFLYYSVLLAAVRESRQQGYQVGIVTNAYWANSLEDALANLEPFAGLVQDLSVSSDLFHSREPVSRQVRFAFEAASKLGIPVGTISIAKPFASEEENSLGQLKEGEPGVMFRGRAAEKLAYQVRQRPWDQFNRCPFEDLVEPGRVHLDPEGYIHICQGISIGNIYHSRLEELCRQYDPYTHPVTAPLLRGGPAELVKTYALAHRQSYADACHLCYEARKELRERFPAELGPGQMYGVTNGQQICS